MRIEIYFGKNGKYYWRMRSGNHKTIQDGSQGYKQKGSIKKMLKAMKLDCFKINDLTV